MKKMAIFVGLTLALLALAAPAQAWDLVLQDGYGWTYSLDQKTSNSAWADYQGQVTYNGGATDWARMIVSWRNKTITLYCPNAAANDSRIFISHWYHINSTTLRGKWVISAMPDTADVGADFYSDWLYVRSGTLFPADVDGGGYPMLEEEPQPYDQFGQGEDNQLPARENDGVVDPR